MPIYEYECSHCKQHCDILQKISDEPAKICPHCSKESLVKLVSAAGFHLKGSGWYATDFKKNQASTTTETKKTDSNNNASKTETTD